MFQKKVLHKLFLEKNIKYCSIEFIQKRFFKKLFLRKLLFKKKAPETDLYRQIFLLKSPTRGSWVNLFFFLLHICRSFEQILKIYDYGWIIQKKVFTSKLPKVGYYILGKKLLLEIYFSFFHHKKSLKNCTIKIPQIFPLKKILEKPQRFLEKNIRGPQKKILFKNPREKVFGKKNKFSRILSIEEWSFKNSFINILPYRHWT